MPLVANQRQGGVRRQEKNRPWRSGAAAPRPRKGTAAKHPLIRRQAKCPPAAVQAAAKYSAANPPSPAGGGKRQKSTRQIYCILANYNVKYQKIF